MNFELTIIIATKNQSKDLFEIIERCFGQKFGKKIEVIVVDDGSTDDTARVIGKLQSKFNNLRLIKTSGLGRVRGLNKAIFEANGKYVCLSAADIFFERNFVKTILNYFKDEKTAFVSPFSNTGGNATVWRKKVLIELKGFDEEFNERGTGFRDDTDLAFRAFDLGYNGIFTYKTAKFRHEHVLKENTILEKLNYGWSRLKIHRFDPLLYKKHPKRAIDFFDIRLRFIRNPRKDFEVATGLWKGNFELSSPQGISLVKGNSLPKKLIIIMLGIFYVFTVKLVRLYGSIKYRKLLV